MMRNKILLIIIAVSLVIIGSVDGQTGTSPRDKYTLLTMPNNKRPLTLYKGQFQANAGYKFGVRSRSFDDNGDVINLKKDGNSSVLHYFFLELKYGILDFIELGVEENYSRQGIRTESITYNTSITDVTVNNLIEYKGMGDLFLYTSIRLPFEYKWFDFKLNGGIFLPTANYKQEEPTHTYYYDEENNENVINYHFNNKNGFGVPVYLISGAMKITLSKFTLEGDFTFKDPVKEGANIRWDQSFSSDKFNYTSSPYHYLLDRQITINASIHFQATGWFDIFLNNNYYRTSNGWTEYWGLKYSNPEKSLYSIEPGFELQISPSLTIYQTAGISLTGKNSDAQFIMLTTLSYNLFPFLK
jgi:hypothetical protein